MSESSLHRTSTARLISAVVMLLLALGVAGLTASPASAGYTLATAPQNVTLHWNGTTSLVATWDAPLELGDEPFHYVVELHTVDDHGAPTQSSQIQFLDGPRTATFSTSQTDHPYTVLVYIYDNSGSDGASGSATTGAVVVDGTEVPEVEANVVVVTPPVVTPTVVIPPVVVDDPVPAAVTKADVSPVKQGGVTTIDWKAPELVAGAEVTGYKITVGNRVKWATTTKGTIQGLRAGTHKVKVRAISANGASEPVIITITVPKSLAQPARPALRIGDYSRAVKQLQRALDMPVEDRSGDFDRATREAVKAWQHSHHLKRTGVVNDAMRFALRV